MNISNERTSCMANRIIQWAALTGITMLMSGVPVSATDNGLILMKQRLADVVG